MIIIYTDIDSVERAFKVITPYSEDYGNIITDVETAIYYSALYIASPYCLIYLGLDVFEYRLNIMFCRLPYNVGEGKFEVNINNKGEKR